MRNDIYKKLVQHVGHRQFADAHDLFRSIMEQKMSLRLESERQLLQEPDEDEDEEDKPVSAEDCGKPGSPIKEEDGKQKCKVCGKSFTPHNGEYARCKECFDKQTDAGERASAGRY